MRKSVDRVALAFSHERVKTPLDEADSKCGLSTNVQVLHNGEYTFINAKMKTFSRCIYPYS